MERPRERGIEFKSLSEVSSVLKGSSVERFAPVSASDEILRRPTECGFLPLLLLLLTTRGERVRDQGQLY